MKTKAPRARPHPSSRKRRSKPKAREIRPVLDLPLAFDDILNTVHAIVQVVGGGIERDDKYSPAAVALIEGAGVPLGKLRDMLDRARSRARRARSSTRK